MTKHEEDFKKVQVQLLLLEKELLEDSRAIIDQIVKVALLKQESITANDLRKLYDNRMEDEIE